MPHSDDPKRGPRIDWRAWVALAWAAWFGWLYLRMILETRGAALLAALRRFVGGD
jgi:hypothetical protein